VTQAELLCYVASVFEELGVTYMIGGSQASVYYGESRFTQDIDLVTDLKLEHVPALVDRFPAAEFYMNAEAAREAVETQGQFNIIHPSSGLKVDVFVNKATDYDRLRLARRQRLPLIPGREAYFARPEDIILYKMLYFREGQSDVHVRDILGIIRVSGPEIDTAYIAEWAGRLDLNAIWDAVLKRAQSNE
jgi:hypothetical protein